MEWFLPLELWGGRVVPLLTLRELVNLRSTSHAVGDAVTCDELLRIIDAEISCRSLNGLIDVNRCASLLGRFAYLLRCAWVLQRAEREWRLMGMFIQLAAIYGLTPRLPLVLSADWMAANLRTRAAFDRLPLAMAIYSTFGHHLTHHGHTLALQQSANGAYHIGNLSVRVVPLGALPAGHRYAGTYDRKDPVIRSDWLFPSFTSFLLRSLCRVWSCGAPHATLRTHIRRDNPGYLSLLAGEIDRDEGIVVDYCWDRGDLHGPMDEWRIVIVSGYRRGETIAAHLLVEWVAGAIELHTTERSAAGDTRLNVSMGRAVSVLRRFGLEHTINRGRVHVDV
ncbi:unnamed protein product [Vitrella brassicaformis CCMP3155]|uniref:Uncharacterized protein n=2 Tax=Vitrella brassicaformis TaxID=1169539 RepID=A0A0G4FMY5_VITBC|nr:unnamed protein product [Vitrella brassicaformis CCMP3155]|eukprot:CEM15545.1 unnamed protein product [Vitrella brassicaformis CCMP3155]